MKSRNTTYAFASLVALLAASTVSLAPSLSAPQSQSQQLKPVLKAIDPSQAKVDEAPVDAGTNPNLEQLIPEFGKPDPRLPPVAAPPGPGFSSGWAPAPLQAPNAPDDPRLARLEQAAFGSTYPEHDNDDRIEHLEREVFGKVGAGDPESRMQKLEAKLGGGQSAFGGAPPTTPTPAPQQVAQTPAIPAYMPRQQRAYPPPQTAYQQPAAPAQQPPVQQQYQQPSAPPQAAYQPPPQQTYQPQQFQPQTQQPYQQPYQQQPYQQLYQQPYQQPYAAPQQAYQQPAQPGQAYPSQQFNPNPQYGQQQSYQQPYQAPDVVNAPPSIPQGPITMSSFNRPAPPPSIPQAPPTIPQQQPMQQQPLMQPVQPPSAPQAPPSIPQQMPSYPVRKSAGAGAKAPPARPVYNQAAPYNQAPTMPVAPGQPPFPMSPEMAEALRSMPYDKKAGDYTAQVTKLGGSFARWTNVPVRVHIPMNTPENWKIAIDAAVRRWGEYLPTTIAPATEPADIEIGWINHLMPRQLGITNLEIFNGRPRVTIYLLRPNYYPPDVNEKVLQQVATHEIGHALGIYGHSTTPGDMMYAMDGKGGAKATALSPRDINTLRKIYESAPLPEGFQSPQPISWP